MFKTHTEKIVVSNTPTTEHHVGAPGESDWASYSVRRGNHSEGGEFKRWWRHDYDGYTVLSGGLISGSRNDDLFR